jgi:uncharacterized membrane protein YgdD (TMEM256/DUF423 family)
MSATRAETVVGSDARTFLLLGCACAMVAVALGAFGAHALEGRLTPERIAIWETAARYHFYHSLGLLIVGLIGMHITGSARLRWAGWSMLAGILLFSGSLYVLSVSGLSYLGAVTPFGGVAFLLAWLLLASIFIKRT